jgi:hypothetical protein
MVLGAWYGAANTFNATIKPLLDKLPKPLWTTFDVGDYRNSLKNLAGGSIDTFEPNGHDTFYAKSLITPKNAPLTAQAERAFITYLTNQGFDTDLVCACVVTKPMDAGAENPRSGRDGSFKLDSLATRTLQSRLFQPEKRLFRIVTPCSSGSCMATRKATNHLSLALASPLSVESPTVS